MATHATNAAALAAAMLALNISAEPIFIDTTGEWGVQLQIRDNNGMTFILLMSSQNARDLGKHITSQAGEAMTKIVPARKLIQSA